MPSDMEAVMILADMIHHPNSRLKLIVRRLKPKGFNVDVEAIRLLLGHHDLLKKLRVFRHPVLECLFGRAAK